MLASDDATFCNDAEGEETISSLLTVLDVTNVPLCWVGAAGDWPNAIQTILVNGTPLSRCPAIINITVRQRKRTSWIGGVPGDGLSG